MRQNVKEKEPDSIPQEQCHHYWVIEVANGPTSRGECKYCGETRDFFNSITEFTHPKRKANILDLPKLPKVKLDKRIKS